MTRTRKSARNAGTRFETDTAQYLAVELDDDRIERRARNGVKDRGDISGIRTPLGARLVIECKNVTTLNLSGWLREAETEAGNDDAPHGVVVHKRRAHGRPADQYVCMTLHTLAWLLAGGPEGEHE